MRRFKTIRDLIHDFRQLVQSATGDTSDDLDFSDREIYFRYVLTRALIVKQLLERGIKLSEEFFQTLTCIELEDVDRVECPFIPASGCVWLKSKCPIPDHIMLQSVGTHLGTSFSYVRWDKIESKNKGRLPSAKKDRFYSFRTIGKDTYIYIYNDEFIKNIIAVGIFEDPIEAEKFCGLSQDAVCNPMDVDFHTSALVLDMVTKTAWDTILKARSAARPKLLNNDSPLDATTAVPNKESVAK